MGASCGCNARVESNPASSKAKLRKNPTASSNKGGENPFFNYKFNSKALNGDENLIIYTKENFTKSNFASRNDINDLHKESVENSTFKDKSIAISYSKGYKIDSPNQDKFFVCIDGDLEVFTLLDGHGPFGHKIAQFVQEFFFSTITSWKSKEDFDKREYEYWIKELFKDCQNALNSRIVISL